MICFPNHLSVPPTSQINQNLKSKRTGPFRSACLITEPGEKKKKKEIQRVTNDCQCSDGSVQIIQNPALLRTLSLPCGCALLLPGIPTPGSFTLVFTVAIEYEAMHEDTWVSLWSLAIKEPRNVKVLMHFLHGGNGRAWNQSH